jgi:hypothetical protein
VRMSRVYLNRYRSVSDQDFEVGPFTVLFGKNNAGKTNVLEAIYSVLALEPGDEVETLPRGLRGPEPNSYDQRPLGAVYVDLDRGLEFDDEVLAMLPEWGPVPDGVLRFSVLPPDQVCFVSSYRGSELWFTDFKEYMRVALMDGSADLPDGDFYGLDELDEQSSSDEGPRLRPLFLGWAFEDVDQWVTATMAVLTIVLNQRETHDEDGVAYTYNTVEGEGFLESADSSESIGAWRLRPEVSVRLGQLATLATDLLPDFLDGSIRADLVMPTQWAQSPTVQVTYEERGSGDRRSLEDFGRGASRWLAIAVQVALRIMEEDWLITSLHTGATNSFSGCAFGGRTRSASPSLRCGQRRTLVSAFGE